MGSSGRRDERLLAEAKYAELVGDEVQAFKEESLERLKDGSNPHPNRWEHGKPQQAKVNCIGRARHAEDGGKLGHPMTKSVNARRLPHRCGLALNDTRFILVQATCPTSSFSRSVTLFLSPGARSLLWGYK